MKFFNHIADLHKRDDIYSEDSNLYERVYQYKYFILEEVLVEEIDDELWVSDENIVNNYSEKETPFPYIVLESDKKTLIDGTHRVKAAKKKGLVKIMAYIGVL